MDTATQDVELADNFVTELLAGRTFTGLLEMRPVLEAIERLTLLLRLITPPPAIVDALERLWVEKKAAALATSYDGDIEFFNSRQYYDTLRATYSGTESCPEEDAQLIVEHVRPVLERLAAK